MLCTVLPEETALVRGYLPIKVFLANTSVTDSLVQQKPFRKSCMSRMPKVVSTWRCPARPTRRSAL